MSEVKVEVNELNAREFDLVALNEEMQNRLVRVGFCERTRTKEGEDPKVTAWWVAQIEIVFDGQQEIVEGAGSKPKMAVEKAVKAIPGATTIEDFVELDYDDDFFKQTVKTAEKPLVDYKDEVNGVSLMDMRGTIENDLVAVMDKEGDVLGINIRIGKALCAVNEKLGGKVPALKAFLAGDGLGDNAQEMPHITQLGKGTNAIQEAMRFGQAHDNLLSVMNVRRASGKGLEQMKNTVTKTAVEAAADLYMKLVRRNTEEGAEPVYLPVAVRAGDAQYNGFDAASAALFIKCVAEADLGFNIEGATDMGLDDLPGAVDARAEAYTSEFLAADGTRFNPYIDAEFKKIQRAFFLNLHAYEGSALPGAHGIRQAIAAIETLHGVEEGGKDKVIVEATNTMHKRSVSVFLYQGQKEIEKRLVQAEKEAERKEVAEKVAEGGEEIVNQKSRKLFQNMSATEAAAKMFSLLSKHPEWRAVLKELNAFAKSHEDQVEEQDGGDKDAA